MLDKPKWTNISQAVTMLGVLALLIYAFWPATNESPSIMQFIINGGAIVVCYFVLDRAWGFAEKTDSTAIQKSIFFSMLVFSFVIVLSAIGLESWKLRCNVENARKQVTMDAIQGAFVANVRELIAGNFFDPQPMASGNDMQFPIRAPSGLEQRVKQANVFQDFTGKFYVQRLWADPTEPNSWIHAWKDGTPSRLLVEFSRKGYGCDLTLKPKNNEAINTAIYKSMIVWLQTAPKSHERQRVAFCLRIVDGRTNHWAWGTSTPRQDGSRYVRYSKEDSKEQAMTLDAIRAKPEPQAFAFDITSRRQWAYFDADGGIAPTQSLNDPITCIQNVVIEPGLEPHPNKGTDDNKHSRPLEPSGAKPSTFYVLTVEFSEKDVATLDLKSVRKPSHWNDSDK